MGDPRRPKNAFKKPRRPWSSDQLTQELQTIGTYGLRNKRELWKAQTELSRIRKQARALLALPHEVRHGKEMELLKSLDRQGLVSGEATLDDVLNLKIEGLLERRLQSVVMKKKFAHTPYQARQAVVHGHVVIKERVVNIPGYIVKREEEDRVAIRSDSPYARTPPVQSESGTESESGSEGEHVEQTTVQ